MARKSYIYRILARLAYLQATKPVYQDVESASGLYSWLKATIEREGPEQRYLPRDSDELKGTLQNLEAIGVVQSSIAPPSEVSRDKDRHRWRFAGNLPGDSKILGRDGGSGDEPPLTRTPGDGDGGGPGGLAQILAHPVLFALDEKDLDAALANAFGADLAEGQE